MLPSSVLRTSLEEATALYESQLEKGLEYLAGRGISEEAAKAARLGVVGTPAPTHDRYAGRLSIPYVTPAGVVNLKFRSMYGADPKYLCLDNAKPLLYGVTALSSGSPVIAITEGELDALILTHQVGIPAVGCPGASTWQKHHPRCFAEFDRVLVFCDGDQPGHQLGKRISQELQSAQVLHMPDGMDVTDVYLTEGAEGLRRRAGLDG